MLHSRIAAKRMLENYIAQAYPQMSYWTQILMVDKIFPEEIEDKVEAFCKYSNGNNISCIGIIIYNADGTIKEKRFISIDYNK